MFINMNHIAHISTIFIVIFCHISYSQDLNLYNYSSEAPVSKDFSVKANGKDVFVYGSENSSICSFSFRGRVSLEINSTIDIKWIDIRPLSKGVDYTIENNSIYFTLEKPVNLSIELNGENIRPLFLFANPVNDFKVDRNNPKVKYFESGKIYDAGEIDLKNNETLFIQGGAIVKGTVKSENSERIKILGYGMLDPGDRENRMITLTDCRNVEMEGLLIYNSRSWTIVPINCDEVSIKNIKQINWDTGSDGIDLVGSRNVVIDDCFLKNNDDCVVIKSFFPKNKYANAVLSGRNVYNILVNKTTIWNMSWGNGFEIGFELRCDEVRDITFRDCDIIHVERGAAISIHNGDFATVKNVRYDDIRIEDARHKLIDLAIFLSQYSLDRPANEQERKSRYMRGAWDGVLGVYKGEEDKYRVNRGYIRNITFNNIKVIGGKFPYSIISGYGFDHIVEDITFRDLYILGKKVGNPEEGHFFIEKAKNVLFR